MRSPRYALLAFVVLPVVSGQTYSISTFAGGSLPVNTPGASAILTPGNIAADRAGNLFFVNQNVVLRLDAATGMLSLAAGNGTTGFGGDGGPATSAQLLNPEGLAVDSAGNLYIADTGNQRIRMVANGVISTVAGNGIGGYSGDGGQATSARLSGPWAVAVDSAGNLYIADTGNQRIRRVAGGVITTVAGNGLVGLSGDNGPATDAELNSLYGLAVDSSGNLYIADTEDQLIRKVTAGTITTIAGSGTPGFSGDTPFGLSTDAAGNLYYADRDNNRIRKLSNGAITTVVGSGLSLPISIALDPAGDLYISDTQNHRILKIAGGATTTIAGGTAPVVLANVPAATAQLTGPYGIAVDSAGNLYFTEPQNNRVLKVSNGTITIFAGTGTAGFSGDNGPAAAAQLRDPWGLAVDSAGSLFIADTGNSSIRKVSAGVITTVAGNGSSGFSGDNGPATSAQLNSPAGVAIDSAGNLYIADLNNYRVRQVSGGIITTVAGSGGAAYNGDNIPATSALLGGPEGVAVDSAGNLFIADGGMDNRIRKVTNGVITSVAGVGLPGFSGDNGPAVSAQLDLTSGIATDSAGNLYIADPDNQRIRKISNGVITTIAGNGTRGFSGDGGPAFEAELNYPTNVAVDPSGKLYVADQDNGRIRLLTPAGSPSINTGGVGSMGQFAVAAGSIASAYGTFLVNSLSTSTGTPLPTNLGGVTLLFGAGLSAPLLSVSTNQVNFQVPWELAGETSASLSAMVHGQISPPQMFYLAPFAPAIFGILDSSYRLVDSSNPATAGVSVIQIYCTGLGPVTNQPLTGSPPAAGVLSETTTTPWVTIDGVQAPVLFSGLAPGTVGMYQVNALVPATSGKGAVIAVQIAFGPFQAANGTFYAGVAASNIVSIAVQ